jgi:hypothetical protein
MTAKDTMNHLRETLTTDPEFYQAWVTDLSASFTDEYRCWKGGEGMYFGQADCHDVARKAAENFINFLIK